MHQRNVERVEVERRHQPARRGVIHRDADRRDRARRPDDRESRMGEGAEPIRLAQRCRLLGGAQLHDDRPLHLLRGSRLVKRLPVAYKRSDDDLGISVESAGVGSLHITLPGADQPRNASQASFALVDANQIELAVLNLVVNARDAMPNGGAPTISTSETEFYAGGDLAAGDYARLAVSDNGYGMSAETLAKAIDPFFSTRVVGEGTGLGLSMVHGLALQLKGALCLASEAGRDTRAEFWLPASKGDVATTPAGVADQEPGETQKFRILVVDDEPLIASSATEMLADLGHAAIESNSGNEALDILEQDQDIDSLITDYSMPRMNGLQLARAARVFRPHLPILLATGYAEVPGVSEPHFGRINKPYLQSQLAAEVAKAFKS